MSRPTWECAIERLLLRVAPHMRSECVSAHLLLPLCFTVRPFARIFRFFYNTNMFIMDVFQELILVPRIPNIAPIPVANLDELLPECILVRYARETIQGARRARHAARGVR